MFIKLFHNPFKMYREVVKRKILPIVEKRLSNMKQNEGSYVPPVDILQKLIELFQEDYKIDIDIITDHMIFVIFASIVTTSNFLTNSLHRK